MTRLIASWIFSAGAIAVAAWLFDDISIGGAERSDEILTLAIVAAVFALINTFVAPVIKLLSLPFIIVTLGLMLIVINALLLMLTANIADWVGADFVVDGFWTAVWGSIVISIVNAVLNAIFDVAD
ncbi:phage holin family protein [Solicola gregarius]|uniref:Phage holin family protein n=1 Tax=Solicola gregarius TaxID=2908642 RepID=A0AA46YN60_9ACTN|nr:phage holin family protein [Solicola gregarius]UYM07151.1 phage holin family protein [Solicola gregarius]